MSKRKYDKSIREIEDKILNGKIPAGQLLKDCVLRHRKDLEHAHKRGLYFDHEKGTDVIKFAELLNDFKNEPATLFWWQKLEYYYFFGWRRKDTGGRRYRTMYCSMARKNQKTLTRVPKIFYHSIFESNYNPETYIVANKEDQAKICFNDVKTILDNNEDFQELFRKTSEVIYSLEDQSKISFLTSNPKTADGTRPTYGIIDEYHEFETDEMPNVLRSGMINRQEKILEYITTRGFDKSKPCFVNEQKLYIPILKGAIENDSIFVLIFSPDDDDDIFDPKTWYKGNPNLGITIPLKDFKEDLLNAYQKGEQSFVEFKTKNLNIWVDAPTIVIKDEDWMKNFVPGLKFADFEGKECIAGFDMAMKDDFAALSLTFANSVRKDYEHKIDFEENVEFTTFWWFWITEDSIQKRLSEGIFQITDWIKDGLIEVCEGNYNSHVQIQKKIIELNKFVRIKKLGYDFAHIGSIAEACQSEGIEVMEVAQRSFIANGVDDKGNKINEGLGPVIEWMKELIYSGRYKHDGNPVIRWMVRNVIQTVDANNNVWFQKNDKKRRHKIDGVSAALDGLAMIKFEKEEKIVRFRQLG